MSRREATLLITDMLDSIRDVFEFTKGMTWTDFEADKKTRYAVLRCLEVIGEAANRLSPDVKERFPEIEWGKIIRSRHLVAHEYTKVDYEIVWRIVIVHLPALNSSLEKINLIL